MPIPIYKFLMFQNQRHYLIKFSKWRCVPRISFRKGIILGGRPRGGSDGESPPDAGEFTKMCKKFLKKSAINAVFQPIINQFYTPYVNSWRFWTKTH